MKTAETIVLGMIAAIVTVTGVAYAQGVHYDSDGGSFDGGTVSTAITFPDGSQGTPALGPSARTDEGFFFGSDFVSLSAATLYARGMASGTTFQAGTQGQAVFQVDSTAPKVEILANSAIGWTSETELTSGIDGELLVNNDAQSATTGVLASQTADPCGTAGTGTLFYNSTSNYFCYCNGTDDVRMSDDSTACF